MPGKIHAVLSGAVPGGVFLTRSFLMAASSRAPALSWRAAGEVWAAPVNPPRSWKQTVVRHCGCVRAGACSSVTGISQGMQDVVELGTQLQCHGPSPGLWLRPAASHHPALSLPLCISLGPAPMLRDPALGHAGRSVAVLSAALSDALFEVIFSQ